MVNTFYFCGSNGCDRCLLPECLWRPYRCQLPQFKTRSYFKVNSVALTCTGNSMHTQLSDKTDGKRRFLEVPHLEEVKESHEGCFAHILLSVPEEKPSCDPSIQQLRVFLGQWNQVKPLLSTVPPTEKRLLCFISPRRPWKMAIQILTKRAGNKRIQVSKTSAYLHREIY